jgi:hypothetical protein
MRTPKTESGSSADKRTHSKRPNIMPTVNTTVKTAKSEAWRDKTTAGGQSTSAAYGRRPVAIVITVKASPAKTSKRGAGAQLQPGKKP